ncbi:mannitol dehydrogenase family protein [Myceligenerans crystallogenes]|uniref:Mannitol-1-phosphate 5-dehydrogenase n=1 Tax=Myceligenerans crystallogenes TaxID=316335 RepID=A0ABN2N203_9MICO
MTDRLSREALPEGVAAPVHPERVGIVHLGIGAFHRAHQAVYTERAMAATGDLTWGILGVTQRSATVRDQLRPQGGVYAVLTAGDMTPPAPEPRSSSTTSLPAPARGSRDSLPGDAREPRGDEGNLVLGPQLQVGLVGAVVDIAYPAEETGRVLAAIAAPTTHVITLTITEKGYARLPGGGLDLARVRPDLDALAAESAGGAAEPAAASSAIGLLVRGIAARHRAGGAPLTVLTCDNMVENGRVLEGLVREAAGAALPGADGDGLRAYLEAQVTFPCSMVDRIVPATTAGQRDVVERALGVRDEGLVVGEPFTQWVIEDTFAGPRPAWELAGATFTDDVAGFEQAKLRLLNGTHSLLAYAGALAGHATIAEAVSDPVIARYARTYLFDDALPTLRAPQGLDLQEYGEELLRRFANPHTGHTTTQVAMDGTQKIPFRWGGTLEDSLAAGRVPEGLAFGLASWALFVRRRTLAAAGVSDDVAGGTGGGVDDPRAAELAALVSAGDAPHDTVRKLLDLPGLLPVSNGGLVAEVLGHVKA